MEKHLVKKKKLSATMLGLVIVILLPIGLSTGQRRTAEVDTSFGKVRGLIVQPPVSSLRPVEVYLGIPYGTPPVGSKRFMMPQTAAKWTNTVKDATKMPAVCIQNGPDVASPSEALKQMPQFHYEYIRRITPHLQNEQENCLFLNIYVPHREGKTRAFIRFSRNNCSAK